ncbi:LapA family protein [bacterium]|nr:LapA family protein [candidate division CSSED10-310 bacterium]
MNTKIKLGLSLSLLCLVLIFVIQNVELVDVRLFFWTLSMSGALLFFILFISGVVCGWSVLSYYFHQKKSGGGTT